MLNGRLYRLSWLVAGVALLVALLTLQTPSAVPEPGLPPAFDQAGAAALMDNLAAIAPERPPGSAGDQRSVDWMVRELGDVPGRGAARVRRQDYAVRTPGGRVTTSNVYLTLPSPSGSGDGRAILVVAPRDTPPGVHGGESSSAVLVQLARTFAAAAHDRPLFFVSTGASTLGNAGMSWFLQRFGRVPVAGAVVLEAPAETSGPLVHLWDAGRTDLQALGMNTAAAEAVRGLGGRVADDEGTWAQVARMAVPQTVGDQGVLIARGVPAVALSSRRESPLPSRDGPPDDERLRLTGSAAEKLVASLDALDDVPAPTGAVAIGGRELRPVMARIALLLLALPVLVAAADMLRRLRRARVRLGPPAADLAWRAVPALAALAALYLMSLAGLVPVPAGGAPPAASEVPFDAPAGLAVVLALLAGAGTWLLVRRRSRRAHVEVPVRAAVAVIALAGLLLVLWITRPFALALALPAAHAGLAASVARRRWQVGALAVVAVVPLVALCVTIGGVVDAGPVATGWYLIETGASGARGATGPLLAVLVGVAVWTLGALVLFRARKGLVTAGDAGVDDRGGRTRPRRPTRASEARTIDDRRRRRGRPPPGPPPTLR